MLAFDLNYIKNNKKITELVALLAWDENNDYGKLNKKIDVVINQLILLQNLEQLDADNLLMIEKKFLRVMLIVILRFYNRLLVKLKKWN